MRKKKVGPESELTLEDQHPRRYAVAAASRTLVSYRSEHDLMLIRLKDAAIWKTDDIETANVLVGIARKSRTVAELNRIVAAELHVPAHNCIRHNRLSEHTLAVMAVLPGAHAGWPDKLLVARWFRTDTSSRGENQLPILVGRPFPEGFGDADVRLFELLEMEQLK